MEWSKIESCGVNFGCDFIRMTQKETKKSQDKRVQRSSS